MSPLAGTVVPRAAVTKWLLSLLKEQVLGGVAVRVGDHKAPPVEPNGQQQYPYWVLHSIPGGVVTGPPLGMAQADAALVYQLDSVGLTRAQAEELADYGRERMCGRTASGALVSAGSVPVGFRVLDRVSEGVGGILVTGQHPAEVYSVGERYVFSVTSAV